MRKSKGFKTIMIFYLIFAAALLPIGNTHTDTKETVVASSQQTVVKLNEVKEQPTTKEMRALPKIEELLSDPSLQGATTVISIREGTTGETVYEHQGAVRVRPASVMKLLTGAAALETLGKNHAFQTAIYADGEIKNGTLQGNLYLQGKGDPTLKEEDLTKLVKQLKAIGLNGIDGNIYGDDTWYDADRLSQDLNWSDEPFYTGAQVSALTLSPNNDFDAGSIIIEVYPGGAVGDKATIRTVPETKYVEIINQTKTKKKDTTNNIKVERVHGSNKIAVSGTIPLGFKKARAWASVWEPTDYALDILKKNLISEGIHIVPTSQTGRKKVPENAILLVSQESMSLAELFIPFMKLSNNGHGEVLVKEMGRVLASEGSWRKGLSVMGETLAEMDIDMDTMLLRDGSGMSHKTLVTANEITKLLYVAQSKPWCSTFLNSLPVAGDDERFVGGTLRYRMKGTAAEGNVQAKTGTLNGVSSLAGYVQTKKGESFIFSIMINNHLDDSVDPIIDEIVQEIASW